MITLTAHLSETKNFFLDITREQLNSLYQDYYQTDDDCEEGICFEQSFINYINNQGVDVEHEIEVCESVIQHINIDEEGDL